MAHARKRNTTWQARWRLRSGKETSKDGFPTKKAAEAFGFQQEELGKRFKNTKTSDLKLTLLEFIEEVWVDTLTVKKQTRISYRHTKLHAPWVKITHGRQRCTQILGD